MVEACPSINPSRRGLEDHDGEKYEGSDDAEKDIKKMYIEHIDGIYD